MDRRCGCGEAWSSRRVVRSGQEGVVGAVEGRGVHKRHRPGTTQASRLHPRDAPSHRRLLSTTAAQAKRGTHPGRTGGDLPRTRCRRVPSCDRRSTGPLCLLHRVPGGEPQRRSQEVPGREGGGEDMGERARRPKRCLLATNHFLRDVVARKLREDCSPEQISGWLKREYPEDEAMRISHERPSTAPCSCKPGALSKGNFSLICVPGG
jgi:hypothetical protein